MSFDKQMIEAFESIAKCINTLSDSMTSLQKNVIELSQTQLEIVAALAAKGVSIKSQEVQDMLNDDSNDPKSH